MLNVHHRRLLIVVCGMASIGVYGQDSDSGNWSMGFDYSYGESLFGLPVESSVDIQSYQLGWQLEQWEISASIPYTQIKGPAVFLGAVPFNAIVRLNTERRRAFFRLLGITSLQEIINAESSGISDVSIAASYRLSDDLLDNHSLSLMFDVKLANGDEIRGLGTGATDVAFSVDWQYFFEAVVPEASIGFVKAGNSETFLSEDYIYFQLAGNWLVSDSISLRIGYYQGFLDRDDDIRQVDYGLDYFYNDNFSIGITVVKGDTESSIDNTTSFSFFYRF